MSANTAPLRTSQNLQQKSPPPTPNYLLEKFHSQSTPPPATATACYPLQEKDCSTPSSSGFHEGGHGEQGAPTGNFLCPVQVPGSSICTTDSSNILAEEQNNVENHEVSCLFGMSEKLEGCLLVTPVISGHIAGVTTWMRTS